MTRLLSIAAVVTLALSAARAEAKVALLASKAAQSKGDLGTILLMVHGDVLQEDRLTGGEAPPAGGRQYEEWIWEKARAANVQALVTAEQKGKKLKLTVSLPDSPPASKSFTLGPRGRISGKAKAQISDWLSAALSSVKSGGGRPGPVATGPKEEPEEEPEKEPVAAAKADLGPASPTPASSTAVVAPAPAERKGGFGLLGGAAPLAVVTIDVAGVSRGFNYNDPITGNLRPYKVYFMPTPGASITLYPLAPVSAGLGLGLHFDYHRSLFVESARENGPAYPTTYSRWSVGAEWRVQTGQPREGLAIVPSVAWQRTAHELGAASDGATETELPNVGYNGLRLGVGLEVPFTSSFILVADGAFVKVFSPGDIISTAYLREGSVNELEAALLARVYLGNAFAFEAGAQYQHFFYAFKPEPGDRFVAGGALDQYVHARLGFRLEI